MANGDIFKEMKETIHGGKEAMSQDAVNRMILAGIVQLYEEVERLKEIVPMYKALTVIGSILAGCIVALLWGLLTGQVKLVY